MLSHTKCILETYGHASGHAVTRARSWAKLRSLMSAISDALYRCSSSSRQRKHNRVMRRKPEDISRPNIYIYIYICVRVCVYTKHVSLVTGSRSAISHQSRKAYTQVNTCRPSLGTHVNFTTASLSGNDLFTLPRLTCCSCQSRRISNFLAVQILHPQSMQSLTAMLRRTLQYLHPSGLRRWP